MKKYQRLAVITVQGVVAVCIATCGLYGLRDLLEAKGYVVSPAQFFIVFLAVAGGIFGVAASRVKQEIARLDAGGQ